MVSAYKWDYFTTWQCKAFPKLQFLSRGWWLPSVYLKATYISVTSDTYMQFPTGYFQFNCSRHLTLSIWKVGLIFLPPSSNLLSVLCSQTRYNGANIHSGEDRILDTIFGFSSYHQRNIINYQSSLILALKYLWNLSTFCHLFINCPSPGQITLSQPGYWTHF